MDGSIILTIVTFVVTFSILGGILLQAETGNSHVISEAENWHK
jgi:hypothetical protein